MGKRVIVAARLSQLVEGQTGIESQSAEAIAWAESEGHTVVAVLADHKSGTSQPWQRPNLKPWVTDPNKLTQYDAVVAYKLDRLSRGDNESTNAIETWATDNRKELLTADGLTFPCEGNDGIRWDVTKRIAHQEWLAASERYKRMHRTLQSDGFWTGRAPYGFRLVADGSHSRIEVDPNHAEVIREAAKRYLDGETLDSICLDFTKRGIPTASKSAKAWYVKTLSAVLRHSGMTGTLANGKNHTVRTEAILSVSDQTQLIARMDSRAHRKGVPPTDSALLTSTLFCAKCGRPMYRITGGYGKSKGFFYYCRAPKGQVSCKNMVPMADLDNVISNLIVMVKDAPYVEFRTVAADSHENELARVADEIAKLNPITDKDYAAKHASLMAEIVEIQSRPVVEAHTQKIATDETIGQHWSSLDVNGQRQMLIDGKMRFMVKRTNVDGKLGIDLTFTGDINLGVTE